VICSPETRRGIGALRSVAPHTQNENGRSLAKRSPAEAGRSHAPVCETPAEGDSAPAIARILLPIDFSSRSSQAARQAGDLARYFSSALTLLHVLEERKLSHSPSHAGQRCTMVAATACSPTQREWLDRNRSTLLDGLQVQRLVRYGPDPAAAIAECAAKEHADLILMPTFGTSPFRKLILGSVTERVLQTAPCPVWTCSHLEQRVGHVRMNLRRIVCAVDRDGRARKVLGWVLRLTRNIRASITVVHAIPPGERLAAGARWAAELRREAREALQRRVDELGLRADVHVETGEVPAVVASAAENVDADLLVIGRSADSSSFGALLTNSYSLIRQSHCPVVSV
jgi:nucleotide-binding universal stress UspA family protein